MLAGGQGGDMKSEALPFSHHTRLHQDTSVVCVMVVHREVCTCKLRQTKGYILQTTSSQRLRNGQGIAQLVNSLPCKHGDLSSTHRTNWGGGNPDMHVVYTRNSSTWEARDVGPWGSLARKQKNGRQCLRNKTQDCSLALTHMHLLHTSEKSAHAGTSLHSCVVSCTDLRYAGCVCVVSACILDA